MKKFILIKEFENQKIGDSILIHEFQIPYFEDNGFIEIKGKKKKTKTKTKIEEDKITNEKEIN